MFDIKRKSSVSTRVLATNTDTKKEIWNDKETEKENKNKIK